MNETNLLFATSGLSLLLLIGLIWQTIKVNRLDQVRKTFFASGIKKDLEEVLVDQNRKITTLGNELASLNENLTDLTILNKNNIQKVGFVRFNPFDDAGGNMSFAISLLNNHDNGVVISSLHGREGTRLYAKSIRKGKSESKLTDEEQQAIKEAR